MTLIIFFCNIHNIAQPTRFEMPLKPYAECGYILDPRMDERFINWDKLACNLHPAAAEMILQCQDELLATMLHDEPRYNRIIKNCQEQMSREINTAMMRILRDNPDHINWRAMSGNPHPMAVELLLNHSEHIDWHELSGNNNAVAVTLLRENPDKISWTRLSQNCGAEAINLLLENPDKIVWDVAGICTSDHPRHIQIMLDNPSKMDWNALSVNVGGWALDMLRKNPDKIYWPNVIESCGLNDGITRFILEHIDKVIAAADSDDCCDVTYVDNVMHSQLSFDYMKARYGPLYWMRMWDCPCIFRCEYEVQAKEYFRGPITEELMARMWHPKRIKRFRDFGEGIAANEDESVLDDVGDQDAS